MTDRRYPNGVNGILARTADIRDPRLSAQQRQSIENICKADSETRLLGLDDKLRLVVRARVGIPSSSRTWAILRNGDSTGAGRIREPWRCAN